MSKLEVKENKKLVLKNVIVHRQDQLDIRKFDKEIEKLHQKMKLIGVQTYGPLVVKNSGTKIHNDGQVTVDYEFYMQAHNYKEFTKFFETQDQIICENCIYVRFEGAIEDLQLAYSKLDLHMYENDLQTDGTNYTVYVQVSGRQMIVDIFKPVVSL